MVFASPMPSESALSAYNASYFSTAHSGKPTSSAALAFFAGIAHLRFAFLRRYISHHHISVNRVLELGPGMGFFAKSWMDAFPSTTYSVIETDVSCYEAIQAIGARLVNLSDVVPTDLVVMSHVLEHISDPIKFIQIATSGLRQGGALFIEVPCRDWEHKDLDEPHILFFDKRPLQLLLQRAGFNDIEVSYHGQPLRVLRSRSYLYNKFMAIRTRLIRFGIIRPFSKLEKGLESLDSPLQRAMVAPSLAHRECDEPAWWLRAVARKL